MIEENSAILAISSIIKLIKCYVFNVWLYFLLSENAPDTESSEKPEETLEKPETKTEEPKRTKRRPKQKRKEEEKKEGEEEILELGE